MRFIARIVGASVTGSVSSMWWRYAVSSARAEHLVHADEQLRRVGGEQHLFDEAVDPFVAEGVDVVEPRLLLGQALAQRARRVGVPEDVAARLDLHLELGDGERPRAERLRQPALEVEVAQQAPLVLLDGELAAHHAAGRAGSDTGTPARAPAPPPAPPPATSRGRACVGSSHPPDPMMRRWCSCRPRLRARWADSNAGAAFASSAAFSCPRQDPAL